MQRQEYRLAEQALATFITDHPADRRSSDARYYLALLTRQRGDTQAAAAHLQAVTNPVDIPPHALALLRGQVLLELGDAKAAAVQLETIRPEQLPDDASRAAWHHLLGSAARLAGNLPAAAAQFQSAAQLPSPVQASATLELGKVQLAMNEPDRALTTLTQALKLDLPPDDTAQARALAADVALSLGRFDLAADLCRQIITHHQTHAAFKPAVINLLRALYAAGQDQALLQQFPTLAPLLSPADQPQSLYLAAAAAVRQQNYPLGTQHVLQFYKQFGPDHPLAPQVAYLYAICYFHTDPPGFEKWIASIAPQLPQMDHRHELQYLHAQVAIHRNDLAAAVDRLTPLIDEPANPFARRALLQRAALLEQLSSPDKAAADYTLYAQRHGQDPHALTASARAIDLAFASSRFQSVIDLAPPFLQQPNLDPVQRTTIRFKLAVAQLQQNQRDAALTSFDAVLADNPPPPAPLAALAHYHRGLILAATATPQTTDAALAAIESALRGPLPADTRAAALEILAQLHRLAGRTDEALLAYEQLRLIRSPSQIDPLICVWAARNLLESGRYEPALLWAQAVVDRADDAAIPPAAVSESLFLAGRCQQSLGQFSAAIPLYHRLLARGPAFAQQARLHLAQCLTAAGQSPQALEQYDQLVHVEASAIAAAALLESALIQITTADRLAAANDPAAANLLTDARSRLHRLIILYDLPQLSPLVLSAMVLLADLDAASEPAKARQWCDGILSRQPATPFHELAQAQLLLLSGQRAEALVLLRRVAAATNTATITAAAPQSAPSAADLARRKLTQLREQP
jgi:tetratricopeptide (TPR) repeat protein